MRVTRRERAAWASVAAALALASAPSARADDKAACIAASEDAQQRRLDGQLTEARRLLLYCARAECPAIVKQDCAQWITEVDAALPTVVLKAQGSSGQDLFSVRVLEDGAVVAERLDGRPLAVDPGRHVFRFVPDGGFPPVELEVLASAGDKFRPILAHIAEPTPVQMVGPPTREPSRTPGGPSPLAWVFGGVALAALGTALGFEIAQVSDYDHLSSTCAGHCAASDVDHVGTERWIAGVSAGVGVLALGASAYFFFAPRAKDPPVALDVGPLPGGGFASLSARF